MDNRYNAIVLIFDSLRSDYLSCYGGDTDTEAFESAAEQGITFDSAFGAAPGTPVSHATIYSGQYPSEHGVTGQYIHLPQHTPVMAEWFREAGYDTFGITGPAKMGSDWDYDRGFEELYEPYYEHPPLKSVESIKKSLVNGKYGKYFFRQLTCGGSKKTRFKFELLMDRIKSELDAPFFTLCNFVTVHTPYDPPRPYKQQATPEFSRPKLRLIEYLLNNPGRIDDPDIRDERVMDLGGDEIGRYLADQEFFNEKEIQLLREWYTASLNYLDDELHRFLEFYRRELQDDTILLLTADHGEQLGEQGLLAHSHYFYDETLKIPLIIVGPDLPEGSTRDELVSHVDIFDILCELCGIERPETTSGVSPFSERPRDAVFMEYGRRDPEEFRERSNQGRYLDDEQLRDFSAGRKAIRTDEYRFEIDSNGVERLFELPEQTEVTDPPPETTEEFKERILETLGDDWGVWPEGDPSEVGIDKRVEQNLRDLGYID